MVLHIQWVKVLKKLVSSQKIYALPCARVKNPPTHPNKNFKIKYSGHRYAADSNSLRKHFSIAPNPVTSGACRNCPRPNNKEGLVLIKLCQSSCGTLWCNFLFIFKQLLYMYYIYKYPRYGWWRSQVLTTNQFVVHFSSKWYLFWKSL